MNDKSRPKAAPESSAVAADEISIASGADITTVLMSIEDEQRLSELEAVVETGFTTFVIVGTALAEINNSKLYRATHDTFQNYVADRWDMSRGRAYQLMLAASVSTAVDSAGLPALSNEAQGRALARVPEAQRSTVWSGAVDSAGPKNPSVADIEAAASRITRPDTSTRQIPRRKPLPDAFRTKLYEATALAKSMTKLAQDNRWDDHREVLRGSCRSDVERLISSLEKIRDAFDMGQLDADDKPDVEVVIYRGENTASVIVPRVMRGKIFAILRKQGGKHQSMSDGEIQFPAKYADRLCATLLATRTVAEVVDI